MRTGVETSIGAMSEYGPTTHVNEILTVIDPDSGEAQLAAVDPAALTGISGSLTINAATGAWTWGDENHTEPIHNFSALFGPPFVPGSKKPEYWSIACIA